MSAPAKTVPDVAALLEEASQASDRRRQAAQNERPFTSRLEAERERVLAELRRVRDDPEASAEEMHAAIAAAQAMPKMAEARGRRDTRVRRFDRVPTPEDIAADSRSDEQILCAGCGEREGTEGGEDGRLFCKPCLQVCG